MPLTPIAETGPRFTHFGPFVASVNDLGQVAFQATTHTDQTGVYLGDGGDVRALIESGGALEAVTSHPDVQADGWTSFYARLDTGDAVCRLREGELIRVRTPRGARIGPGGPTMNDKGSIASRVTLVGGGSALCLDERLIADTRGPFRGFQGLPVVDGLDRVVFRADTPNGQGLHRWAEGRFTTLVDTRGRFTDLGNFPCANTAGDVVFAAHRDDGRGGVYRWSGGESAPIAEGQAFESYRGALISEGGQVWFYATPPDGTLGLYAAEGGAPRRILGLGDALFGSTVVDFALNPVSVNARGQLAVRMGLEDERGIIVRIDPE